MSLKCRLKYKLELIVSFYRFVLNQILSGEATEVVVEKIHEFLTNMGENVRAGKVNTEEFIIFKVMMFLVL